MGGCGFWRVRVRVHVKIPPGYPCRSLSLITIRKFKSSPLSLSLGSGTGFSEGQIVLKSRVTNMGGPEEGMEGICRLCYLLRE